VTARRLSFLDALEVFMMLLLALAAVVAVFTIAGCATDDAPALDATAAVLPSCGGLGCDNLELTSKPCAERGECFCRLTRDGDAIACTPGPTRCAEIGCAPTPAQCSGGALCACPNPNGDGSTIGCAP
jgi:hypothetical protein